MGARQVEAETFIIRLARALHSYGSPAHRLEDAMSHVAESLGIDASFFASPTAVMVSFGMDSERRTVLDRVRPGEHNLEKLVELDQVATRVGRELESLKSATADIDRIVRAPLRYGPWMTMMAFGVASGGAGRFFGQGVVDLLTATIIGLLIGLLAAVAERSSSYFGRTRVILQRSFWPEQSVFMVHSWVASCSGLNSAPSLVECLLV